MTLNLPGVSLLVRPSAWGTEEQALPSKLGCRAGPWMDVP